MPIRVSSFVLFLIFFIGCAPKEQEIEGMWYFKGEGEYQDQDIFLFMKNGKLLYWNEISPNLLHRQKFIYDDGCVTTFYLDDSALGGDTSDFPGSFCVEKVTDKTLVINANGGVYEHIKVAELFDDNFILVENNDSILFDILKVKQKINSSPRTLPNGK